MNIQTSVPSEDAAVEKTRSAFLSKAYRHRWFALFVVFPVLLSVVYYGFVASDQYVSESRFVIKSPGQRQSQYSSLANLIQTTGLTTGQEQANEVLEYIHSRNALEALQKRIDLRAKFMSSQIDWLSRFPAPWDEDAFEDLFKYYGKAVIARIDSETGVVVLETKAFSPKDAHDLNASLLMLSEDLVNRLNDRAQNRSIAENQKRLVEAETRLRTARIALRQYRNSEELLDPAKQATGVLEVTNRLVGEQAALRAQLELIERMAPNNPSIPTLRNRIASIGNQIAAQSGRAVGTQSGIASKLAGYENLAVEQEFATQMLQASNTALEQARIETQKQQFYLERVVEPNTPDLPLLPKRIRQILTIAIGSVCLYFIGWMLLAGIREHAPED